MFNCLVHSNNYSSLLHAAFQTMISVGDMSTPQSSQKWSPQKTIIEFGEHQGSPKIVIPPVVVLTIRMLTSRTHKGCWTNLLPVGTFGHR